MPDVAEAQTVEFRPDDNREAVVRLSFPKRDGPDGIGTFSVEVEADGVNCQRVVLTLAGDGLDRFFADLASDWRGWKDVRRWDALESGMIIEATHQRNRVELLFIVRRDYMPDAWEGRLPILVAPGESLARLAKATAELLAVE
jgi:Family of unknown function (DUF6228)